MPLMPAIMPLIIKTLAFQLFLNGIIAGINGMKTSSRQSVYMAGNLFTTVYNIPKAYRDYLEG